MPRRWLMLADASTWADEIKHVAEGSGTGNWHFLDLADSDGKEEIAERCPGGDCITAKLSKLLQALEAGQGCSFPELQLRAPRRIAIHHSLHG
jgi:hypothetical protein